MLWTFGMIDGKSGRGISLGGIICEFSLRTFKLPCFQDVQMEALNRWLCIQGCRALLAYVWELLGWRQWLKATGMADLIKQKRTGFLDVPTSYLFIFLCNVYAKSAALKSKQCRVPDTHRPPFIGRSQGAAYQEVEEIPRPPSVSCLVTESQSSSSLVFRRTWPTNCIRSQLTGLWHLNQT